MQTNGNPGKQKNNADKNEQEKGGKRHEKTLNQFGTFSSGHGPLSLERICGQSALHSNQSTWHCRGRAESTSATADAAETDADAPSLDPMGTLAHCLTIR